MDKAENYVEPTAFDSDDRFESFECNEQEIERLESRLGEIECLVHELGLTIENYKVVPSGDFEAVWGAIWTGAVLYMTGEYFKSSLVTGFALFLLLVGLRGPAELVIFKVKINSWRPKLAEWQTEIDRIKYKLLGDAALFWPDFSKIEQCIDQWLETNDITKLDELFGAISITVTKGKKYSLTAQMPRFPDGLLEIRISLFREARSMSYLLMKCRLYNGAEPDENVGWLPRQVNVREISWPLNKAPFSRLKERLVGYLKRGATVEQKVEKSGNE